MGLKNHTEIDDEIYINSKGLSRCEIIASSAEEAADIFNNKYKLSIYLCLLNKIRININLDIKYKNENTFNMYI
jgi:hypothetical protein